MIQCYSTKVCYDCDCHGWQIKNGAAPKDFAIDIKYKYNMKYCIMQVQLSLSKLPFCKPDHVSLIHCVKSLLKGNKLTSIICKGYHETLQYMTRISAHTSIHIHIHTHILYRVSSRWVQGRDDSPPPTGTSTEVHDLFADIELFVIWVRTG